MDKDRLENTKKSMKVMKDKLLATKYMGHFVLLNMLVII